MLKLLVILQVLRVLAIGNSFSIDALEQSFVPICQAEGVTAVVGNLYIPSCSLSMHAENARHDSVAYSFRTCVDGQHWDTIPASIRMALAAQPWDVITLQQASNESGVAASYEPHLGYLIDYVQAHARTRENGEKPMIAWHQTWAYPLDSRYAPFAQWDYDQSRMYDSIVSCTERLLRDHTEIAFVIPVGAAVQAHRQLHPDEQLCRDGLHLSFDQGRPLAARVWLETIRHAITNTK